MRALKAVVMLAALLFGGARAEAEVLHHSTHIAGSEVEYEVVLPAGYQADHSYPTVLAFGGGPQTIEGAQRMVAGTFQQQAEQRGYIVVIPAAPEGQLFFEGGQRIFPQFLRQLLATYKVEGGKFLVAGASNGGISAFYIASLYPQYFRSITAFPGYLPDPTPARVRAIASLCIHMFVGQNDELGFGTPMQQEAVAFRRDGMALTFSVEKGQPHRIATLSGAGATRLFDLFEQDRRGCSRSSS